MSWSVPYHVTICSLPWKVSVTTCKDPFHHMSSSVPPCHGTTLSMPRSVPTHVIIRTNIQRSEHGHVNIHQWQNPSTHLSIHPHFIISLISIHQHLVLSKSSETKHHHHLKQYTIILQKTSEHNVPYISSNTTTCETALPHTFAPALTVNHLFGHIMSHLFSIIPSQSVVLHQSHHGEKW